MTLGSPAAVAGAAVAVPVPVPVTTVTMRAAAAGAASHLRVGACRRRVDGFDGEEPWRTMRISHPQERASPSSGAVLQPGTLLPSVWGRKTHSRSVAFPAVAARPAGHGEGGQGLVRDGSGRTLNRAMLLVVVQGTSATRVPVGS